MALDTRKRGRSSIKHTFWRSLIAAIAGNAIYFSIAQFLPPRLPHQPYQLDWGLALDFLICLLCYLVVRLIR